MRREVKKLVDLQDLENGAVGRLFETRLQQVMADVADRPALAKSRKLTIELEIEPVADAEGQLADLKVAVSMKTSMPAQRTREVSMRWAAKKQALVYNDEAPDDVRQGTLDEEQKRGK